MCLLFVVAGIVCSAQPYRPAHLGRLAAFVVFIRNKRFTMARPKKASRALPKAEKRLAGLKSIDAKLNLGNGATIQAYESKINAVRSTLADYNRLLSQVDAAYNKALEAEDELAELSSKMLKGVAWKYGETSSEYEMAGGKRKGERRRKASKPVGEAMPELTPV